MLFILLKLFVKHPFMLRPQLLILLSIELIFVPLIIVKFFVVPLLKLKPLPRLFAQLLLFL